MKKISLVVLMLCIHFSFSVFAQTNQDEDPCPPKQPPPFTLGSLFEIPSIVNFFNWGSKYEPACKDHNPCDESVPLCPENSTLLGPEYPVMAMSVGDQEGDGKEVIDMIDGIIKENPSKPPQMFLTVKNETKEKVKKLIKQHPSLTEEQKKKWLGAYTASSAQLGWHQDFYESYVNLETGMPTIRPFEGHDFTAIERINKNLPKLLKNLDKTCNIKASSSKLFSPLDFAGTGGVMGSRREYRGGNIEPAPGGGCLVGRRSEPDDAKWDQFKKDACKGTGYTVELDTSVFNVGHVDEIVKFVKTDDECGQALIVASPSLGVKAMKEAPEELTLDLSYLERKGFIENYSFDVIPHVNKLCKDFTINFQRDEFNAWYDKRIKEAAEKGMSEDEKLSYSHSSTYCIENLKNKHIFQMAEEKHPNGNAKYYDAVDYLKVQERTQKFIDKQVSKLVDAVKTNVPKCSNMKKVALPQFNYSWSKDDVPHGVDKVKPAFGNPVNGVQYGKTMITSSIHMPALDKKVKEILKNELGMKTVQLKDFVSSTGGGGTHCRSHFIRYCRPRSAASCQ